MLDTLRPLYQRLIVGTFGVVILLIATYLSTSSNFSPIFAALIAGAIAMAVWEFYNLCLLKGYEPLVILGVVGSWVYSFSFFLQAHLAKAQVAPYVVLFFLLVLSFVYFFGTIKNSITNLSVTFFGFIYLTIPLSFILRICFFQDEIGVGRWWFLYLLSVVKLTDVGAYIIGKRFGKNKLAPYISPKKTWEGALGGFFFGVATSFIFILGLGHRLETNLISINLITSIGLGVILSIAAQFGDLAESLLKRDAGVKDSNQLPGLGGMLDIVDSLVFTAPMLYLYLSLQ